MNPAQQLNLHYQKADRFMLVVTWLLLVMSFGLAPMYQTYTWAFSIGLPVALIATACVVFMPGSLFTRMLMGATTMAFTGLHIHQAGGVTELHFGVFVLLAVLVCYRDWRVILTAAIVIAVHHVSFNYLQELGYGVICFAEPGFGRVVAHASYVVVESAILCYVAVWLHRDAVQAAELEYVVDSLCPEGTTRINLRPPQTRVESKGALALLNALQTVSNSIARVRQSADTIAFAADEISSTNNNLHDRSQRQAESVQDTASAIQELSTIVAQNASGAAQANQQVSSATDMALQGTQAMTQAVQTIGEINSVSSRIADIVTVIDSIAFQTNLLALNAAVEAARAGEQGKGFAVVASEVQSLAQRSAKAAQEIKSLIEDSVQAIQSGNAQVTQAGAAMDKLATEVRGIAELFEQIERGSTEQSQGIGVVNSAISHIDEAAHQNVALVDRARVSTQSLQEQANLLLNAISVFSTQRDHSPDLQALETSGQHARLKVLPA